MINFFPSRNPPIASPPDRIPVMGAMPHCDSAVLHAPGECEYCDAYPAWQEARKMWRIAFTGHRPEDGELPCPSEVARSIDTINEWPGNRPSPPVTPSTVESHELPHFRPSFSTPTITYADGQVGPLSGLGRSNVPTTRRDLEEWVREIVMDIVREQIKRNGH